MNEMKVKNNIQSLEQRLESTFSPVKKMLDEMKVEHTEIMSLEITPENCLKAKELSKKYQKLRSATDELHKNEKAFYLNGGRKIDEWKRDTYKLIEPAEKESKERAEHFELIEKARIEKLHTERELEYKQNGGQDIFTGINFGEMTDEVWSNFLVGVKVSYEIRKAAEEKAEQERRDKEALERAEQIRIKAENERLKKEAEEQRQQFAALANIERLEREKIQKENDERLMIERAEREKKEQELRAIQEAEKTRIRLEKEAAEKAEAERLFQEKELSMGSDREKWNAYISRLQSVQVPEMTTEIYKQYSAKLKEFFEKTVK
jgi:hypothetical protein